MKIFTIIYNFLLSFYYYNFVSLLKLIYINFGYIFVGIYINYIS